MARFGQIRRVTTCRERASLAAKFAAARVGRERLLLYFSFVPRPPTAVPLSPQRCLDADLMEAKWVDAKWVRVKRTPLRPVTVHLHQPTG
jgi:hypothetical protein